MVLSALRALDGRFHPEPMQPSAGAVVPAAEVPARVGLQACGIGGQGGAVGLLVTWPEYLADSLVERQVGRIHLEQFFTAPGVLFQRPGQVVALGGIPALVGQVEFRRDEFFQ